MYFDYGNEANNRAIKEECHLFDIDPFPPVPPAHYCCSVITPVFPGLMSQCHQTADWSRVIT